MKIASRSMRALVRSGALAVLAGGALVTGPASAQAANLTIGSPLVSGLTTTTIGGNPGTITVANVALGSGGLLTSPVDGTIVRWRITAAAGGPFHLRVLRPAGPVQFTAIATGGPQTPASLATQTFAANIPIKAGDLIGLQTTNAADEIGAAEIPGSSFAAWLPPFPDGGSSAPAAVAPKVEVAYNAEVQPVPVVGAVTPAKGSIGGGTAVQIFGHDFTGATAVTFGGVPAATLPITSETQISAVAPKATKPGAVDIVITTPGGQSAATLTSKFTYTACVVPKLKGGSLKATRKKLKKAGCKLGRVKKLGDATTKTGRVVKQNPPAGKIRAPGVKVAVKLGTS